MTTLALLLLAARVLIVDDNVQVPAQDWRALELGLQQRIGMVDCSFRVVSQGAGVRVMLMTMGDLQKLRNGQTYSVLDGTSYVREGSFNYRVPKPGDYVIVIDNRFEGRGPATVHLTISADYSNEPIVEPRYAPSSTRLTVILLSTLFFLAVSTYFVKRFAG